MEYENLVNKLFDCYDNYFLMMLKFNRKNHKELVFKTRDVLYGMRNMLLEVSMITPQQEQFLEDCSSYICYE